jgi:hypothetical protein
MRSAGSVVAEDGRGDVYAYKCVAAVTVDERAGRRLQYVQLLDQSALRNSVVSFEPEAACGRWLRIP